MPFTFSHPAIILPLRYLPKRWYSLTGLIIGSVTPDFEYFLRMKVQSYYSHTWHGLFWFDLPLGLLLAFLFHNHVRNGLFDNLPLILKSRLSTYKQLVWNRHFKKNWVVISISFLIGAASHLFWDSFTHEHGYFVQIIPELTNTILLFGKMVPLFKVTQHASTLIGAIVIAFTLLKLPPDKDVKASKHLKYWSVLFFLTLLIVSIRLLSGLNYTSYGHVIVTGISAGLISLVFTPWLSKIKT